MAVDHQVDRVFLDWFIFYLLQGWLYRCIVLHSSLEKREQLLATESGLFEYCLLLPDAWFSKGIFWVHPAEGKEIMLPANLRNPSDLKDDS